MANIRKYKDTEEKRLADNARKYRYNVENYTEIRARMPKEYNEKIEYISKEMNISKAQALRNCIDTLYNALRENE